MKKICMLFVFLVCGFIFSQTKNILWYEQPAEYFEESLVLGNGKMGASIFGGTDSEKIYLNDITLWSGEPVNPFMNPEAHNYIPKIRKALFNENYKLADSLNKKVQGAFSQSYAPLGTLYIHFKQAQNIKNYKRTLDISKAISNISYKAGGVQFEREYFVSHPQKIMAIKLTADKKNAINCEISFKSLLKYTTNVLPNKLQITGYAPYHAEPNYRGAMPNAVRFDKNRGTRFAVIVGVKNTGGRVIYKKNKIHIRGANTAVIYLCTATSFNGFDKDPATNDLDALGIAHKQFTAASDLSYKRLKSNHIHDYQNLFNRVHLDFGKNKIPDIPTDERLKRYSQGYEDRDLEALYFQFGRYLLICSSRTKGVPANLQGLWNHYLRPPWSSNYTMNINTQENYWLAETANLSELHKPLLSFIANLAQTGTVTAKTFYGVSKGWAACHNSDIWAMSNPVGDFGKGDPCWANWNMSGVWLSTHLWEHYNFSSDIDFLKQKAYPLMKGAAEFCLGWLVKDKKGKWITAPSTSPENIYITDRDYKGQTLYGATCDLAMIRELFLDILKAAKVLKIQDNFTKQVRKTLQNLHPYQIGADGSLQEWYYDWRDADPKHRHQTHLFGLYPGTHINFLKTPALAKACEKALMIKGDKTTGWSKGWRINLWARLFNGAKAYQMYRELLTFVTPAGKQKSQKGGTFPNLLDAHPPFQIDGNFGGTAAVIEMLMQSTENTLYLLPALPKNWEQGKITGICARGGLVVDIYWKNHSLQKAIINAKTDSHLQIVYKGTTKKCFIKKGKNYLYLP